MKLHFGFMKLNRSFIKPNLGFSYGCRQNCECMPKHQGFREITSCFVRWLILHASATVGLPGRRKACQRLQGMFYPFSTDAFGCMYFVMPNLTCSPIYNKVIERAREVREDSILLKNAKKSLKVKKNRFIKIVTFLTS